MKKVFQASKWIVLAGATTVGVFAFAVWNVAVSFVEKGLADSQSIRVSQEKTSCSVTQADASVHFSGCNSIL